MTKLQTKKHGYNDDEVKSAIEFEEVETYHVPLQHITNLPNALNQKKTLSDFPVGNNWGITSKSKLQRFVGCPHCLNEGCVPEYTRYNEVVNCPYCNKEFRFIRYD